MPDAFKPSDYLLIGLLTKSAQPPFENAGT